MAATLTGFGLLFAPTAQTARIESAIHDAALPGLQGIRRTQAWAAHLPESARTLWRAAQPASAPGDEASIDTLRVEIAELEQTVRQLQSQNAHLLDELDNAKGRQSLPILAESGTPLFVPELLTARIVAADDVSVAIQRASAQRIVDVGQTDGVVPADFVVSGEVMRSDVSEQGRTEPQLLIDQGDDVGVRADQPVFAGRCVVGKIAQVGRWTSSILPVTASEFRGRARLMRRTTDGLVVGPEGILAGDGADGCQLNFISADEPVSIGDEVYTPVEGTPLPAPMYYGRVTSAVVPTGSPYWEVSVAPAETMDSAREVQVLRVVLNPARTAVPTVIEEVP